MFILEFKLNQQRDQVMNYRMYEAYKATNNLKIYYDEKVKATDNATSKAKHKK
jgi:hypothetical protein